MFTEVTCWTSPLGDRPDILRAVPMDPGQGEQPFERNGHGRPSWREAGDQEAEPTQAGYDRGHATVVHATRIVDGEGRRASCDN